MTQRKRRKKKAREWWACADKDTSIVVLFLTEPEALKHKKLVEGVLYGCWHLPAQVFQVREVLPKKRRARK